MRTILRLALIPAVTLGAAGPIVSQTATATPPTVAIAPSVPTSAPPPDVGMTVTVTGCLELSHSPVVAGATADPGGATTPSKYILTNARAAEPEHGATPDAKVLTASTSVYNLYGNEGAMMTEVGHTVEVGGTVDRRDRLSQDVGEGPNGAPSAPRMAVMSIRTLGVACEK
jgi:hypothetical protein